MQLRMFITYILMFFCSYVWIKSNHMVLPCRHSWPGPGIWCSWTVGCLFYRKHLCHHLDKIPGLGQGWRFAGTVQCLVDVFPTLLFIKNAVQGTANVLHDGQVDVRTEACLCTHRQMNIICILLFLCLNKKNNHVIIPGQDQESDVHGL